MTKVAEPNFPAIFVQTREKLREFDKQLVQVLGNWSMNIKAILDGGISMTDNMDASIVTYTSNGTANTEDTIAHGLGKTPTGYIAISKDKAADVYTSSTATATNLYLKCSVVSATIKLLVF